MANIQATPQEISNISGTAIGQDGIMVLKMIGEISSDILVCDIIISIWNIHRNESSSIQMGQLPAVHASAPPGYVTCPSGSPYAPAAEMIEMEKA